MTQPWGSIVRDGGRRRGGRLRGATAGTGPPKTRRRCRAGRHAALVLLAGQGGRTLGERRVAHKLLKRERGVLVEDVEQLHEVTDDLTRRDMAVGAHACKLHLQEGNQVRLTQSALVAEEARMDVGELLHEHEQLLRGQRLELDDGGKHVHVTLARKASLCQTAAQRLVAVEAAAAVLHTLGSAAHDDAQVARTALERVVVHGEDLLVVVLARNSVGNLVQVHELIDKHNQTRVARALEEARKQLDVVVPVVVADDDVHAQVGLGLGTGAVLAAKPPYNIGLRVVVGLHVGAEIHGEQACEVIAVHHVLQLANDHVDALLDLGSKRGVGRVCQVEAAFARHLHLHVGNPAVKDERERAALGTRLGGKVADKLSIGGQALALRTLQATLGRQVGVGHDEALAHGVVANGLQQEALARAIAAHEEAERRAPFPHKLEIVQKRLDLGLAAHGDVRQAHARHDAALERVDDDRGDATGHPGGVDGTGGTCFGVHRATFLQAGISAHR